jgi:hypothetical protein
MGKRFTRDQLKIVKLTPEDIAKRLRDYEAQYGMTSKEFYRKYNRGELDEELDFMKWAGYFDAAARVGLIDTKTGAWI